MQEICESHSGNSFITCCSIFSKNKHIIESTQTCNIVINNKQELFVFYGIKVKINIFVHFTQEKLDKFTTFLIKSYSFVHKQSNNDEEEPDGDKNLLKTLSYNLQSYENDYYENSVKDYNNLFTLEIIDKNVEIEDSNKEKTHGMKLSLIFTNYFVAAYYFNRFSKLIKIEDKEYKIFILPLDSEKINPNLKRIQTTILDVKEYIHYQISSQISIWGNVINIVHINKDRYYNEFNNDQDKYYILFHPNSLIDTKYRLNKNYDYNNIFTETINNLTFVKSDENNHNINWFVLGSNIKDKCVIRCCNFNHTTLTQKIKVSDNINYIKYEKTINDLNNERLKQRKDIIRIQQRTKNDESNKINEINRIMRCNNKTTLDTLVTRANNKQKLLVVFLIYVLNGSKHPGIRDTIYRLCRLLHLKKLKEEIDKKESEERRLSRKRPLESTKFSVSKKPKLIQGVDKKTPKIDKFFTFTKVVS